MKACGFLIVCLLLSCRAATAQVGTWQMQITRVGSTKETGIGYVTLSEDGSVTGYAITTLTYSVPTFVGSWSSGAHEALTMTFTETVLGQGSAGEFSGKFSSKSITGTAVFENGVTYKLKGVPAQSVADASGNWSGTVREEATRELSRSFTNAFSAVTNSQFQNVFDLSGLDFFDEEGVYKTGQVVIAFNGNVVGYQVDAEDPRLGSNSFARAYFTGHYNASKGTLTMKALGSIGEELPGELPLPGSSNVKATGKFQKE
jgi:hypothetical protein